MPVGPEECYNTLPTKFGEWNGVGNPSLFLDGAFLKVKAYQGVPEHQGSLTGVGDALVLSLELAAYKPGKSLRIIKSQAVQSDVYQRFSEKSFRWEINPHVHPSTPLDIIRRIP